MTLHWPRFTRPGELDDAAIDAMWRLRTRSLALKPEVDRERDRLGFHRFVRESHVARVAEPGGRVLAMFCHQRIDGVFQDHDYRLALFEYGYVDRSFRGHPSVAPGIGVPLITCRRRGALNYFAGVGYPRSVVLLHQVIPALRLDGDPRLGPLERHLLDRTLERAGGLSVDPERRVVELPTLPDPLGEHWRARHRTSPLLADYEARVPDWTQGRALAVIGRLDGSGPALARELVRRVIGRR